MKLMLPTLTFDVPAKTGWCYEVKYDGFRAILDWDGETLKLTSRNGNSLLPQFPEIKEFIEENRASLKDVAPIRLDGELVLLESPYKGNFSGIQVRGRMRSEKKIIELAEKHPAKMMVFDLLAARGKACTMLPYLERKEKLEELFIGCGWSTEADKDSRQNLQYVTPYHDFHHLWEKVVLHDGEGIVAKNPAGTWEEGKRSIHWLKYKNFKFVTCFLTAYEKSNGYYYCGVYSTEGIKTVGHVLFGFKPEEKQALSTIIKQNKKAEDERFIYVEPAICFEIKYLELYDNEMREPHFHKFRFDLTPEQCTFESFVKNQKNLPDGLDLTHPDKPVWEETPLKKIDFIHYLRETAEYMLPFLKDRLLTVIRFPHGMFGDPFYQKNCPEYAPDFVETYKEDEIEYIVCNNLKTLIWLGNQLAIEYHIPFQKKGSAFASEIVLDLDPPSPEQFHLAVIAAQMIKGVLDNLNISGFVKTSGNKGLQVYIPVPENRYTFEDTRLFTEFIAEFLVSNEPELFTIERMKKNRGGRLYVDYIQHAQGKTIIAPYSPRGNSHAGVATPLFWDEVREGLSPKDFTIPKVLARLQKTGDPLRNYFDAGKEQNLDPILDFLRNQRSR